MATYTSTTSGLFAEGSTWVGGVSPPSAAGHKVIIAAGHTVTLDTSGEWGDDTSSATVANNAFVVNGKLIVSPGVTFTLRGTLAFGTAGSWEIGTDVSPIPRANPVIVYGNYSPVMGTGKHVIYSPSSSGNGTFTLVGEDMTRNTALAAPASAGATSVQVVTASNWLVNDELTIASDTRDPSRVHRCTVTSVSGTTIGISPALNFDRTAGCLVGNRSAAISILPYAAANGCPWRVLYNPANGNGGGFNVKNVRFRDNAINGTGWTGGGQANSIFSAAIGFQASSFTSDLTLYKCVFEHTTSGGVITNNQAGVLWMSLGTVGRYVVDDCLFDCRNVTGAPVFGTGDLNICTFKNSVIYHCNIGWRSFYGYGTSDALLDNCDIWAVSQALGSTSGKAVAINNCRLRSADRIGTFAPIDMSFTGCDFNAVNFFSMNGTAGTGTATITGCNFNSTLIDWNVGSSTQSPVSKMAAIGVNGASTDHRVWNTFHYSDTELSTKLRGVSAFRMRPRVANSANAFHTWTVAGAAGVSQRFIGYLRFDSTYGTGTPPSVSITGAGVSASFTAPAVADTWHKFDLTVTPTSTGALTFTLRGQSAATTGYCWIDGVAQYPFTPYAWHYGFLQTTSAAPSNVGDSNLTHSEAAVAALTSAATLDDAYDASKYWSITNPSNTAYTDLCTAVANVLDYGSYDVVIDATAVAVVAYSGGTVTLKAPTLAPGTKFTKLKTTGAISFVNSAAPSPALVYEDGSGTSAPVLVQGVRDGSKVRLVRTDTSAELAIGTAGASGFQVRLSWTTDIPLRADTVYASGTDAEDEASGLGTLTANGATITVVQSPNVIYEANAIDGTTLNSTLTLDVPNIEIDADEADNVLTCPEVYAWYCTQLMTDAGMRSIFGALRAVSQRKYIIDVAKVNMHFDNQDMVNTLLITLGVIQRSDGTSIRAPGTGSIEMLPDEVYLAGGGFGDISESGQTYGKQFRDMRAVLLGKTTGGGTTTETFLAADGSTPRVVSTNDGTNRTAVSVPGA